MRPDDYARILDALGNGVYVVDRDRRITFWNAGAAAIAGYESPEMVGHACYENRLSHVDEHGNNLCTSQCPLHATMQDGVPREVDVFLRHRDGHRLPVKVQASPLRDERGEIIGAVEVFHDASAERDAREHLLRLERDALIDGVTGVGNRRFADAMLETSLAETTRLGWPFAVILLDLDGFKAINDRRGHLAGDRALKTVATTTAAAVRRYDHVARWGGDEFLVLCPGLDEDRTEALAERLRAMIAASLIPGEEGPAFTVTVSLGVALARPGDTIESLLGRADAALYASKAQGRNRVSTAPSAS